MASVSRETMEKSTSKPIGGHSTFLNGYPLAGSYRFGQIQPHFVQEVVPDDDIELSTAYKLDSYTLSQPLMQDLFITHGYYFVPLTALLPNNYEKFITNPNIGEDVDPDNVGLSYDFNNLSAVFSSVANFVDAYYQVPNYDVTFLWILRWVLTYDMIYGLGGLPASLGYKFITKETQQYLESFYDNVRTAWEHYDIFASLNISSQNTPSVSSFHQLVELLRDDFDTSFTLGGTDVSSFVTDVKSLFDDLVATGVGEANMIPTISRRINMSRILSYQIVCAHFFSNDKIDYIYSAELFRQNVLSVLRSGSGFRSRVSNTSDLPSFLPSFTLNGENYNYDVFSSYNFFFSSQSISSVVIADLQYLRLIFGFNNSLRHVDYFTGSRTRPLAVGNVGVQVNNNVVDVVDTIQTTWFAKFLNQVNRTGRRISNYMKGLFPNVAISQDWHDPIWLGDTTDKIASSEVENTGSAQQTEKNSITSNLQSNASKYGFRYHNTQYYGIIIGLTYFDLERFYPEVTERPIFHVDRFDMFNPFMQFNGDQEVYGHELLVNPIESTFGYQSRYLEYKQRVPQAFGAFLTDPVLSKSIFIADDEKLQLENYEIEHVSPTYIRSHPLEFDKFYLSLTGLSLAQYYHFQIIHWNRVKSVRPMVFNPQLG